MKFVWFFLGGRGGEYHQKSAVEAATDAAPSRAEVIVASTCRFVAFDGANRVRSAVADLANASGGQGGSPPLIFPIS